LEAIEMAYGILLLRLVLGATLAAHGAQKLFGSFDGPGLRGLAGFFGNNLRFRAPFAMAVLAALAEFGGGAALAAGLVTPFAALAIAVVMLNAIGTAHIQNGFWAGKGGYEYNLLIWSAAVALAATGGARFSLDAAFGWADNLSGLWWGVGVAAGSAAISLVTLTLGRRPSSPPVEATPEGETPAQRAA
jgi:putative oxidoreductase